MTHSSNAETCQRCRGEAAAVQERDWLREKLVERQAEVEQLQQELKFEEHNGQQIMIAVKGHQQERDRLKALCAELAQDKATLVLDVGTLQAQLAETQQELQVMRQLAADLEQAVRAVGAERDRLGVLDGVLRERRHHPKCMVFSGQECGCWLAAVLSQRTKLAEAERDRYKAVVEAARKWRNEGGGWAAPAATDLRRALAALDASPAHTPGCQCHGCLDSAGHRAYTAATMENSGDGWQANRFQPPAEQEGAR